jgi:hypothetical protein
VPINEGGSSGHILRDNAYFHYTFLSNHIAPGVLIDPAEIASNKRRAENWAFTLDGGFLHSAFKNNAVSYMFSLHTSLAEANNILVADRHVQFGGVSGCSVGGGTTVQRLGAGPFFMGWSNNVHGIAGNLLLNDGHVEFASQGRLREVLSLINDSPPEGHFLTPY